MAAAAFPFTPLHHTSMNAHSRLQVVRRLISSEQECALFKHVRRDKRKCPPCRTLRTMLLRDGGTYSRELAAALKHANFSETPTELLAVKSSGTCHRESCSATIRRLSSAGYAVAGALVRFEPLHSRHSVCARCDSCHQLPVESVCVAAHLRPRLVVHARILGRDCAPSNESGSRELV